MVAAEVTGVGIFTLFSGLTDCYRKPNPSLRCIQSYRTPQIMKNHEETILNNALWRIRRSRGLELKQVAWLLGHKTSNLISSYERGERTPNLLTGLRLAVIYGCQVENLFPERLESYRAVLTSKALRLPRAIFPPSAESRIFENLNTCSYERLLEQLDLNEQKGRLVRDHITKLAKSLARL